MNLSPVDAAPLSQGNPSNPESQKLMVALLTYPAARPALRAGLSRRREGRRAAAFADGVWELHRIISNPISRPGEVKIARQKLLRTLRKSKQFPIHLAAPQDGTAILQFPSPSSKS